MWFGGIMTLETQKNIPPEVQAIIEGQQAKGRRLSEEAINKLVRELAQAGNVRQQIHPSESRQETDRLYQVLKKYGRGGVVNPEGLTGTLGRKIWYGQPIRLFMFWGASDKPAMNGADSQLVEKLGQMTEELRQEHRYGVNMEIIFGDVHVIGNGYTDPSTGGLSEEAQAYFGQVQQRLRDKIGARVVYLSQLYHQYNVGSPPPVDYFHDPYTEDIFQQHAHFLTANARSHNNLHGQSAEEAARIYMATRMAEKPILSLRYPDAILIATGRKTGASDIILPTGMPAVFLGDKAPWFQR